MFLSRIHYDRGTFILCQSGVSIRHIADDNLTIIDSVWLNILTWRQWRCRWCGQCDVVSITGLVCLCWLFVSTDVLVSLAAQIRLMFSDGWCVAVVSTSSDAVGWTPSGSVKSPCPQCRHWISRRCGIALVGKGWGLARRLVPLSSLADVWRNWTSPTG